MFYHNMVPYKATIITDGHGNIPMYEYVTEHVVHRNSANVLLVGGDNIPHYYDLLRRINFVDGFPTLPSVEAVQEELIERVATTSNELAEVLAQLKVPFWIHAGNIDMRLVEQVFGERFVNDSSFTHNGMTFYAFGGGNRIETPPYFHFDDSYCTSDDIENDNYRMRFLRDAPLSGMREGLFPSSPDESTPTLTGTQVQNHFSDARVHKRLQEVDADVVLLHRPIHGLGDKLPSGERIGSVAPRTYLADTECSQHQKPKLVATGHIHPGSYQGYVSDVLSEQDGGAGELERKVGETVWAKPLSLDTDTPGGFGGFLTATFSAEGDVGELTQYRVKLEGDNPRMDRAITFTADDRFQKGSPFSE